MDGTTTIFFSERVSEKKPAESWFDGPATAGMLQGGWAKYGLLKNDLHNLLVKIDELGSIVRAAKSIGVSYKVAWDTLILVGNNAGKPLVCRCSEGKGDGSTRLTSEGRRVVLRLSSEMGMENVVESQGM